jgi:hypothetical protein
MKALILALFLFQAQVQQPPHKPFAPPPLTNVMYNGVWLSPPFWIFGWGKIDRRNTDSTSCAYITTVTPVNGHTKDFPEWEVIQGNSVKVFSTLKEAMDAKLPVACH